MKRVGHLYYRQTGGTAELEYEQALRRERCRRVDSPAGGHVALENPQVMRAMYSSIPGEAFEFVTRVQIQNRYGSYASFDVPDAQLAELVDLFTKYLELPTPAPPPIEVRVLLTEPARARRRRSSAAAEDTSLSEKEQIKRNLMGGRR